MNLLTPTHGGFGQLIHESKFLPYTTPLGLGFDELAVTGGALDHDSEGHSTHSSNTARFSLSLGLIFIHGLPIFMTIIHMSLQTVLTVELFVTFLTNLGLGDNMSIGHMSLQTVLTKRFIFTLLASLGVSDSKNIGHMSMLAVLTVKLFVTLLTSLEVVDLILQLSVFKDRLPTFN